MDDFSPDTSVDPIKQEDEFVHEVYNDIASHFSLTRYRPWPLVESFLVSRKSYSIGIDVGCGNGRYLGVNDKLFIIGTDRSDKLINCAKELSGNQYDVGVADGLHLPHQDNTFDFAISIAVIHHFATQERRILAIKHILSKVRVGGEALIYCWALEQESSRRGYKLGECQDKLIPWVLKGGNVKKHLHSQSTYTEKLSSREENKDLDTKYRYYHLYKKGELVNNALQTGICVLISEGYEKDNWWVIVRRI